MITSHIAMTVVKYLKTCHVKEKVGYYQKIARTRTLGSIIILYACNICI